MVDVVTDVASLQQTGRHLVSGLQLHGCDHRAAVFSVLAVSLAEGCHLVAVDPQAGTAGLGFAGSRQAVDGNGEAIDASAGGGEDAGLIVVVAPQVKEDVFVDDGFVGVEGALAGQGVGVVQSDREGTAAGCRGGGGGYG